MSKFEKIYTKRNVMELFAKSTIKNILGYWPAKVSQLTYEVLLRI